MFGATAMPSPNARLEDGTVACPRSAAPANGELFLELLRLLLGGRQTLRAQEKFHQLLMADLTAGPDGLNQLLDQTRKPLAGNVVVGPAEVAMALEDLGERFLQRGAIGIVRHSHLCSRPIRGRFATRPYLIAQGRAFPVRCCSRARPIVGGGSRTFRPR